MQNAINRRLFLQLAGAGGVVWVTGCASTPGNTASADFYFVQLSDTHWGFKGAAINPDSAGTFPKTIAAVNALNPPPDFVVFTGDLTHISDDPAERRQRLKQFKAMAATLTVPVVHYMPGEHDASLDNGAAYQEFFGATHYSFDHKGVHFIALDNVSDPHASIGAAQLQWLQADLATQAKDARIIVFTHRPLFDLYPSWDWATADGAQALALLEPYSDVTVFYGHIHQEHHQMTGHIAHHAAHGLMFALPAPGSQPKRTPIAWDATAPYKGLGYRRVAEAKGSAATLTELPLQGA
ncbi:metallophosphoesterase family protein [Amantichitinum ursilacus]|uniref:3',5'-cyclic adenosine monophosphate phosphodiesterase CpdA n=1 Tax=Amantichitinum ursilacus TaxID=857265 RepID=A0A0N0XKP1_9NEIS|nr:metallophosphoesterase [Amantichitinum ursilacus]KPC54768.1 3',5'-cyclic adenosine monophosphate phosphodiesterase CpdA [Amantichitinum ursilacus]